MNQTPPVVIWIVVISIAFLAFVGLGSLSASLFLHVYADPSILTAIISTTSLLVGALVGLLSNPRSPIMHTTTTTTENGTITSVSPVATPVTIAPVLPVPSTTGEPLSTPVTVTNTPEEPVPTSDTGPTKTP